MSKYIPWIRLLTLIFLLLGVVVYWPDYLSDQNGFLKDFLDNDLLSVLGFIIAVTLASTASIHLQINELEEQTKKSFNGARDSLRLSALTLIVVFAVALALVVIKPIVSEGVVAQGLCNSIAVVLVYTCLEVMWDITKTTFAIRPLSCN